MTDDIGPQIEWLARLIAHDTVSSKSNLALIDDVEAYLKSFGAATRRIYNDAGDKANLYAVIGPATAGGVVLSGHTDVVPVDGQDWATDPFRLTERDGLLYGRGTCDMKAFSAVALSLVPEMAAAKLRRPIILALSYDEEIGLLGAPRMIEAIAREAPTPEAVIVGEPTMMKVVDGHKGIASFRTTVTGHTTHSSQTDRGVSAVEAAARLIVRISDMRAERAAAADRTSPFDPPYSTMTVNVAHGGSQLNIMAGECRFDWDCRVIPGEKAGDVRAAFDAFAATVEREMQAKSPDCRIRTEQLSSAPALAPSEKNPAADLAKALTGQNATHTVAYAAEAGQFQEGGFSTVICGPGSIDQAHQANEFISRAQVAESARFMRKLIARLAA